MSRLTSSFTSRPVRIVAAATVALFLASSFAEARSGSGGSFGNRGSRSSTSVPSTPTAPRTATPLPGAAQTAPNVAARAPVATAPARSGFGSMLMGGLLGAGLFGLLSGSGLFGGLGGLASILGLLVQGLLLAGLVMLVMRFFRSRNQPAMAGAMPGASNFQAPSFNAGMGGASPAPAPVQTSPVNITPADFNVFEQRLGEVQGAYSREDGAALANLCQPDVAAELTRELAANRARGHHNQLGAPKLLQGDLAEAWREGNLDYASVAMRYSLSDAMVDRTTGRVVTGDLAAPQEVTEVWTFVRPAGEVSRWSLSAIQQA